MNDLDDDDKLTRSGWEQFFKWFKFIYLKEA